ncbi:acetate--CoA ligase [Methanobacterium formicicum]|jgi:acetyl-CoA synthetase|uniref:Acetate--CoA ligase n=2 Tax=Methanobacterium TaxID=2160 RepID=A0A090I3L1_METFO|nr:acetate--CoA ligase [Methanobacterium formicicum]AIS30844.1 acetyl-CoA synthetase AcsA1 [Methanobacterium formicicum]MBF4474976.1 acetate--CoA ligase [Methanobacterium formicicum]MDG3547047.1 acetate--CoA ligase [Methanobacterium formicicum]MDH2659565.1 acetate--CoA ligase [Methanobacterium formicicum]CEA13664.1 Acetyl-coenzyme A synthetase [Methanobacterium formicicum]
MVKSANNLDNEKKVFKPNYMLVEEAHVKNWEAEIEKGKDIEKYWAEKAEQFEWFQKWDQVLDESNKPFYKWFTNGKINLAYNAVDRWIHTDKRNQVAILYANERGDEKKLTYYELYREVNKMANALKNLGVEKGDTVSMYMPMCPELLISMLACNKIGAVHSVVYSGLSVGAFVERMNDAKAKILVTADGTFRRGKVIDLKKIVDEAMLKCHTIETTIVVKHAGNPIHMSELSGKEIFYDTLLEGEPDECPVEEMDSEDPLFILYTSGSTGKPKAVLHTTAGYMVGVATTLKTIFDIHNGDLWWCTGDIGWITGHSYLIYGPLLLGTTTLVYEGAPDYPDPGIWWKIVEKYGVTKLYTSPTAIRHLMRYGNKYPTVYNLSSLKILGSVGEPMNPAAWMWLYRNIGQEKTPIMDTWWQTETGMHMISPLPVSHLKPGTPTLPFPGVDIDVVDENGNPVPVGEDGYVVVKKPWPAMFRTLYKDEKRFVNVYWKDIPGGVYRAGDMARKDEDGYIWIQGRSDDVLKIAGHRVGTSEVEAAFSSHPAVAEAAVIGKSDPVKGQVIKAFVILKEGYKLTTKLISELQRHVRYELGPVAVLGDIVQVDNLPKTRSGKIMRRVLRAREEGKDLGDLSTLEDG